MVVAAGLAIGVVGVHGGSAVLLGQQLLNLPVVHPCPDGELEVLAGDGVPVLHSNVSNSRQAGQASSHTLYTIMTPKRLQIVAKKRPSR